MPTKLDVMRFKTVVPDNHVPGTIVIDLKGAGVDLLHTWAEAYIYILPNGHMLSIAKNAFTGNNYDLKEKSKWWGIMHLTRIPPHETEKEYAKNYMTWEDIQMYILNVADLPMYTGVVDSNAVKIQWEFPAFPPCG